MHLNSIALLTVILAAGFFGLGVSLRRKLISPSVELTHWIFGIALAVPAVLFALYYTHIFDRAAWFYSFRTLPYSEIAASGVGFVLGVAHAGFEPETLGERLVAPVIAGVLVFLPFVKPMLAPLDVDRLSEQTTGEVCLQSTPSTCGPSSAVMILRLLGQPASEKELAQECFTYRGGTEVWYIARAFRRRGFDTSFLVQPASSHTFPSPAIAGVVLPGGSGHFISILSRTSSQTVVGDPLKGKLIIDNGVLQKSYTFTGFFLVIRPRVATPTISTTNAKASTPIKELLANIPSDKAIPAPHAARGRTTLEPS